MTEINLVIKSSLPVKTLKTVIENLIIKNITPRIPKRGHEGVMSDQGEHSLTPARQTDCSYRFIVLANNFPIILFMK